jgi:hypothetical protein
MSSFTLPVPPIALPGGHLVTGSLYERANGYSYDAVKIFMPAGAKKPVYAPYREHVPPDTTAAIFWLKNRDPARWRDDWQIEHAIGKYVISEKPMSEEQWIRERATMIDVTPSRSADYPIYASDRYRNGEPLKPTRRTMSGSRPNLSDHLVGEHE